MRDIIEILRLSQDVGRSTREIARIVGVVRTTVGEIVRRANLAGVSCPVPTEWDNAVLEAKLYPPAAPSGVTRPLPDWALVHRELGPRPPP
jgi:transposase